MKVFVAGASGAIGVPLVRALVASGHEVTALTRSAGKLDALRALGATPVVADALDPDALRRVVAQARPTHVIHQLTALPKGGPRRARELEPTNRLRIEGTRNLLAAAVAAGARRLIVGSFAPFRDDPSALPDMLRPAADAIRSMESQVVDASRAGTIEGIVLRYGLFYGPGNPATEQMIWMARHRMLPVVRGDRGVLPVIHVDDAVAATVAALDRGRPGTAYDIVDDRPASITEIVSALAEYSGAPRPLALPAWVPRLIAPYMAAVISVQAPASNEKARAELGWRPMYPNHREGLSRMLARAA